MNGKTKISWAERVTTLSINPHAASIDDIVRMATELSEIMKCLALLSAETWEQTPE